jgi:predicted 3-demethylubiquinone-9 3-methyltransferase (glyoxalase superfamily)
LSAFSNVEIKTKFPKRETSMGALEEFPRITPFLWFDNNAEDAVNFYLSVFKNSRRLEVQHNSGGALGPRTFSPSLSNLTARRLQPSTAARSSSSRKRFPLFSDALARGGRPLLGKTFAGGSGSQCGWLKDKFGLSWQIVPARLPNLIKTPAAMQAMLKMTKLDIAELERAAKA